MSIETVLTYLFLVLLLYTLARLFAGPLRTVFRFLLYICLGIILIYGANWLGGFFGATLAVNPFSILIAGFLNIPGLILLFVIQYWLRL